jgi:hypothetical protein
MVHDAEAVVPVKVHDPPNVPLPLVVSVTMPVGVMNVPGDVSVTVTMQVVATPMIAFELQEIEEDRDLMVTFTMAVAFGFAAKWPASPP